MSNKLSEKQIEVMKAFSIGGYPRMPMGSALLLQLFRKEVEVAMHLGDIPRVKQARYILTYCLN